MEEKVGNYPWTSHGQYVKDEKKPLAPVEAEEVLRSFSKIKPVARKRYRQYVLEALGEGHRGDLYDLRSGRILGDENFEMKAHRESGSGLKATLKIKITTRQVWEALLVREGLGQEPVGWKRSRLIGETTYWMVECAGKMQTEIAAHFKVQPTTIHEAFKRQKSIWEKHPEEREKKETWLRNL